MVESGCKCTAECVEAFSKLHGSGTQYRYIMLGFNKNQTKVQLVGTGPRNATFEDMLSELPRNEVRFIFYDCHYQTKEAQLRDKVLFVVWSDDDHAPLQQKMMASSTSREVAKRCPNFAKKIEIHDFNEFTFEYFVHCVSDGRKN